MKKKKKKTFWIHISHIHTRIAPRMYVWIQHKSSFLALWFFFCITPRIRYFTECIWCTYLRMHTKARTRFIFACVELSWVESNWTAAVMIEAAVSKVLQIFNFACLIYLFIYFFFLSCVLWNFYSFVGVKFCMKNKKMLPLDINYILAHKIAVTQSLNTHAAWL